MSVAPIWVLVTLGLMLIVALVLLRFGYPYKTIRTDNFVVKVPQPWLQGSIFVVALLELCRHTALTSFALAQDLQIEVEIRPSWRPAFWFQPESNRIVLCFVFGPALDKWLFSVHFAVAHEYGHCLSKLPTKIESEVWANMFCLYMLRFVATDYAWPQWWEKWLVMRDVWGGLVTMYLWRFLPGQRHEIAVKFWLLWHIAQRDSHAVISALRWDKQEGEND